MLCLLWIAGPTKHQIAWEEWSLVEIFTLWLHITGGLLHKNNLVAFFLIKWMHIPHISVSQLRLFDNRNHYTICFIEAHIVWRCHCWFCESILPTWTVLHRSFKRSKIASKLFDLMIVEISWSRVASWILKISGRISALSGKDAKLAYLYFWGAFNISKSSQDLKIVPQLYFASNFIGFCKKI